jgi:hypothetical protein
MLSDEQDFWEVVKASTEYYETQTEPTTLGLPIQARNAARHVLGQLQLGPTQVVGLLVAATEYFNRSFLDDEGWLSFVDMLLGEFVAKAVKFEMGDEYQHIFDRRIMAATSGLSQAAE